MSISDRPTKPNSRNLFDEIPQIAIFRFDTFQFTLRFNPGTNGGNVETSVDLYEILSDS